MGNSVHISMEVAATTSRYECGIAYKATVARWPNEKSIRERNSSVEQGLNLFRLIREIDTLFWMKKIDFTLMNPARKRRRLHNSCTTLFSRRRRSLLNFVIANFEVFVASTKVILLMTSSGG